MWSTCILPVVGFHFFRSLGPFGSTTVKSMRLSCNARATFSTNGDKRLPYKVAFMTVDLPASLIGTTRGAPLPRRRRARAGELPRESSSGWPSIFALASSQAAKKDGSCLRW
jgi:hypothetical protein